ncbi:SWIM zinc finger family protein [Streptomyces cinerochromogenes]|uniref:SWIM zinc finger family protein n=1 Tax=Streptomyces cinerochromogenes TaxID=66422 RepID=UPI00339FE2F9
MTGPDGPRPADVARRALRAARHGAGTAGTETEPGDLSPKTPSGGGGGEPGDAEHGALSGGEAGAEDLTREGPSGGEAGGVDLTREAPSGGEAGGVDLTREAPSGGGEAGGVDLTREAPSGGDEAGAVDLTREAPPRGSASRPGDVARAALRAAFSTRRGDASAADEAAPVDDVAAPVAGEGLEEPAPGVPEAGPGGSDAAGAGAGAGTGTGAGARAAGVPGGRPGDAAREALRAARREALRAEAAEPRRERRAPAPSGPAAPAPDGEARATRARAAQEMRHYLATAFRMPTWTDTPDEPEPAGAPTEPTPTSAPSPPAPAAATPATPHVPPTMATPHRDSELRRTFPAFAVREGAGEETPFAGTWWGNAWVAALERGALDGKRLARGRGYAERGHVDAITVTPGLVLAYVRGSRPRPYRVQVRVRTLGDEDWERFLDAAADRPGHIAALLDKELPHSLADCGVPLLPGPGDLTPRCSCPDSGHPCKHAAALCYQTARLLDADPFVLLLLRGRGEKELLDALSRRSAARAAREAQPQTLPGVRATEALAARERPPLPPPSPVPPHPGQPPAYPSAPGGPDPFALDQLATDAAARAHALLGTGRDPVGELTLWQDAVRLAAARPGSGLTAATRALYATLADAVGRTPADLARAVAAWRQGGPAGLAVLEEPWDPPAGRFDRARPLLLAADLPAFRPWRNRLTHPRGHVQLRLGREGLWYAYESEPGQDDWWPRGTPDLDPVGALTGLGIPDDAR